MTCAARHALSDLLHTPALALALAACGGATGESSEGTTDASAGPTSDASGTSTGAGETTGESSSSDATTSATSDATSSASASETTAATTEVSTTATTTTTTTAATTTTTTTTGEPTDTTGGADELPPQGGAALQTWLTDGAYLGWPAESGPHPSTGPHFGSVRTFVNQALYDSLEGGNAEHPADVAAVKELYGDGDTVLGWSVAVKLQADSDAGNGWYWYERYGANTYADGVGIGLCTGCHGGGQDYVLTPFPLQ